MNRIYLIKLFKIFGDGKFNFFGDDQNISTIIKCGDKLNLFYVTLKTN